jgi:predicted transcriptional regulator
MAQENKKVPLILYVTADIKKQLAKLAAKDERSLSYVGERMLQQGLSAEKAQRVA